MTLELQLGAWLESVRSQEATYRKEDNGDDGQWSTYNQGRADALKHVIDDVTRMISKKEPR